MEQITLAVAEVKPSCTYYTISLVRLDWLNKIVYIQLAGENKEEKAFSYHGATAENLMQALNKANLSTRSLRQRIFDKLIADGLLSGTVGGTVE